MATGQNLRTGGSATGNDSALLLAGVASEDEEFPTASKGRKAAPVDSVTAETFRRMLLPEGDANRVRFVHCPPKDEPADASAVTALKSTVSKWLTEQGINTTHRGEYTTTGKDSDGKPARVAYRIIKK